jgi:hypothetical protein
VAVGIKTKISAFCLYVGLIMALHNPGMKEQHWKQIPTETGKTQNKLFLSSGIWSVSL